MALTIMALTAEEKELLVFGLHMRKNFIETGDALMSAIDAQNMGVQKKIKALGNDQINLIQKINDLILKIERASEI